MIRLFCIHLKTHAKRKKREKIERLNIRLSISPGEQNERSKKTREIKDAERTNQKIEKNTSLICFFLLLASDHIKNKLIAQYFDIFEKKIINHLKQIENIE